MHKLSKLVCLWSKRKAEFPRHIVERCVNSRFCAMPTNPLRLFSPSDVHITLQSDHIVVLGFVTI